MGRRVGYSVRKLRSGRYQVLVRDPATGVQRGLGSFADKREAERAGQQHAAAIASGMWFDPTRGDVPIADYLTGWLDRKRRMGHHGDRYADEAARLVEQSIVPFMPARYLSDLSPSVIRTWHADLVAHRVALNAADDERRAAAGLPPRTGRRETLVPAKAYRLLHAALEDAVRDELIPRNPAIERSAGVERSPERPLIEPPQIAQLAAAMPEWWSCMVLVAGWCGLRFGELQRLRRADVDPLHATIRVTKAKSTAGVRVVNIPAPLLPAIEAHLARWSQPGPDGLVFAGPRGGALNGGNFGRAFRDARRSVAGAERVTFHDLRHATGTMAAQAGATERELMSLLGHASPDAARRYQHAAERRKRDLADKLGAMFNEAATVASDQGSDAPLTRMQRASGRKRPSPKL